MKEKIVTTLLISFISVELVASGQGEKVDEKELTRKRQETYQLLQKNDEKLKYCSTSRGEARGNTIRFPEGRSDVIFIYRSGYYFAVKILNKKVELLWSMCDGKKAKPLKKTQYKSILWKNIATSQETGQQYGRFPDFEGGYDVFDAYMDSGTATRIDKNGREVCSYENVISDEPYMWVDPKITKLCKP